MFFSKAKEPVKEDTYCITLCAGVQQHNIKGLTLEHAHNTTQTYMEHMKNFDDFIEFNNGIICVEDITAIYYAKEE